MNNSSKHDSSFNFSMLLALLVAPGFLPQLADLLVSSSLMSLPNFVNPLIFRFLAALLYLTCVPLFLVLRKLRVHLFIYPIAGALLPVLVTALLPIVQPIATLENEEVAWNVFFFSVFYVAAFGAFSGLCFAWAISQRK